MSGCGRPADTCTCGWGACVSIPASAVPHSICSSIQRVLRLCQRVRASSNSMIAWHRQYYISPLQFIGSALSRCIALAGVMVIGLPTVARCIPYTRPLPPSLIGSARAVQRRVRRSAACNRLVIRLVPDWPQRHFHMELHRGDAVVVLVHRWCQFTRACGSSSMRLSLLPCRVESWPCATSERCAAQHAPSHRICRPVWTGSWIGDGCVARNARPCQSAPTLLHPAPVLRHRTGRCRCQHRSGDPSSSTAPVPPSQHAWMPSCWWC